MSRIQVFKCDRCGDRLDNGQPRSSIVYQYQPGSHYQSATTYELCGLCDDDFRHWRPNVVREEKAAE